MLKKLLQLFRPKLKLEVSGHHIVWEKADGKNLEIFLNSTTGMKLRQVIDLFIIQHGFNPAYSEDFQHGLLELYHFIITRVPGQELRDKNATSGRDTDDQTATGGSIIFPARGKK